jgi:hypothetical protein
MRKLFGWFLGTAVAAVAAAGTPAPLPTLLTVEPDRANELVFPAVDARFVRLMIQQAEGEPCLDELEVYGPGQPRNLALASTGAKASASSLLPGHAIHQVAHLNDGLYGNSHSWIAASARNEWAQIELAQPAAVDRVVISRDREGRFRDRRPVRFEVRTSLDGTTWATVGRYGSALSLPPGPLAEADLLRYAFACEAHTLGAVDRTDPVERTLGQFAAMIERFAARGQPVERERAELAAFRRRQAELAGEPGLASARPALEYESRLAKRRLFLRAPDLAAVQRVLFVSRQPYEPSHNYSDLFDPTGPGGGGVCVLDVPRADGRLDAGRVAVRRLFDARDGVVRDAVAGFDARRIYFAYRPTKQDYFHLWRMDADGSRAEPLTEGPFHDVFPCPVPDGGLAFVSTRCKARFLCWRPQAYVLFRMDPDGQEVRPLSFANLSEWYPTVLRDGRLLWTRSEYLDKGANFGHTLWAVRPDGSHPELIFGNDTPNCYAGAREVPGTDELLCTLVSHGGDFNGPIALIDRQRSRFDSGAIRSLTPDVPPQYDMNWLRERCFRDPVPISRDYYLCSHAPADRFGLYLLDRWGNRELLYLDPDLGSMSPSLLRPEPTPPRLEGNLAQAEPSEPTGQFFVADVYRGLEPAVARGAARYIRVCQEVRADLNRLPNGEYRQDHEPFPDWYATPVHKVSGPLGWPTYVAKADLGLAEVEADGSANFLAPAGKVLYFELLDADYNELQRMRSVVQLQPGERRGCVGCHEDRRSAPVRGQRPLALRRAPATLAPPPWGTQPFAYETVVQPVWDRHCVRCHDRQHEKQLDLTGRTDPEGVPASYRTLIEQGLVHYFDCGYAQRHTKAAPRSFGTLRSRLWQVLDAGHHDVQLPVEDRRRVKAWIDLNCPLWPDYEFRPNRPALQTAQTTATPAPATTHPAAPRP